MKGRDEAQEKVLKLQQENDMLLLQYQNLNEVRIKFFMEYTEKEELLNEERKKLEKEKSFLQQRDKVLRGYLSELSK